MSQENLLGETAEPTTTDHILGERCDRIEGDPFLAFLRGNVVGMHAAVLYRRDILPEAGGFDPRLRRWENCGLERSW